MLPRILEHDDIVAVVSQLDVGPHTGWPITYFGPREPRIELENDWGRQTYTPYSPAGEALGWDRTSTVLYDYDFDLEPWLASGKVRWIAPDDSDLTVRTGVDGCPYLKVPGERQMGRVQRGKLWYGS